MRVALFFLFLFLSPENEGLLAMNPNIVIVDDDSSVRNALCLLLGSVGYVTKSFASADEFLDSDRDTSEPSCLILDVKMPKMNGLDLQKKLSSLTDDIPIIFITGHGDIPMSVEAMKSGAVDFLPKPFDDQELLKAVQAALSQSSHTHKSSREQAHLKQHLDSLSPREYEILTYLLTGMLNKQIAYDLDISERTVKAHRKQVLQKMGVNSIAELVRLTNKLEIEPAQIVS